VRRLVLFFQKKLKTVTHQEPLFLEQAARTFEDVLLFWVGNNERPESNTSTFISQALILSCITQKL
jgi:hypothetical protein